MSLVPPCCGCLSCMTQLLWTCLRSAGLGLWRQSALSAWSPACCAQSASRQLALMFVCCRPRRHTAGCLAAQVCPARTARSGERQCQGYPDRRAGHLGPPFSPFAAGLFPASGSVSLPSLHSQLSQQCLQGQPASSSSVHPSAWLVLWHSALVDLAAWTASRKSSPTAVLLKDMFATSIWFVPPCRN